MCYFSSDLSHLVFHISESAVRKYINRYLDYLFSMPHKFSYQPHAFCTTLSLIFSLRGWDLCLCCLDNRLYHYLLCIPNWHVPVYTVPPIWVYYLCTSTPWQQNKKITWQLAMNSKSPIELYCPFCPAVHLVLSPLGRVWRGRKIHQHHGKKRDIPTASFWLLTISKNGEKAWEI